MSKKRIKALLTSHLSFIPKSQRYKLLRYMMKIPGPPDGVTFEIARTPEDLDAAFSLLYDAYRREKLTPSARSRRRITIYHSLATTSILVAKLNSEVIATVSIIKDAELGVPAQDLVDLNRFRVPGKCMAEVSSLALRDDLQGRSTGVMFYLSKYLFKFSREYLGVDRFIITFHPKQLVLYEGLLLFKPLHINTFKNYGFANNAPAVCATLNLETAKHRCQHIYGNSPEQRNLHKFLFRTFSTQEKACMQFIGQPFPFTPPAELSHQKSAPPCFTAPAEREKETDWRQAYIIK